MGTYQIRIQGHLHDRWAARFAPLTLTRLPSGETLLSGELTDQGALYGVLLQLRDLGLTLTEVRVERVASKEDVCRTTR
jgi:hypothetical protein